MVGVFVYFGAAFWLAYYTNCVNGTFYDDVQECPKIDPISDCDLDDYSSYIEMIATTSTSGIKCLKCHKKRSRLDCYLTTKNYIRESLVFDAVYDKKEKGEYTVYAPDGNKYQWKAIAIGKNECRKMMAFLCCGSNIGSSTCKKPLIYVTNDYEAPYEKYCLEKMYKDIAQYLGVNEDYLTFHTIENNNCCIECGDNNCH